MRICVVEDDQFNRDKIASIIKKNTDYDVVTAENGVELLNMFKILKNDIPDLILLDVHMPKMDGFEVAKILRNCSLSKEIPIIFVTALNDTENLIKGFEIGGTDYISKPFRKNELLARINAHLNQKRLYDELKKKKSQLDEQKTELEKKTTILETSLEILSHDSKNIFTNIQSIISQCPENPILYMIEECINELFELTMEAVGYISARKRIYSIIDIFKKIRITGDRILLSNHKRIKITYPSNKLLFIESTSLLKNAITNLVENALKYSPKDSIVEIKIENVKDKIIINILDKGSGIPGEEINKIFEKYYRRGENTNIDGSGKGLWITKNIIENEGGNLKYTDNSDGGSIFTIEIQLYKIKNLDEGLKNLSEWFNISIEKLKRKEENFRTLMNLNNEKYDDIDSVIFINLLDSLRKDKQYKSTTHIQEKLLILKEKNIGAKKILIIDDSLYVHYYLGIYFVELGYNITDYAFNGEEGILKYKKIKPDLVTLDNTMPIISGLETAKQIYDYDKDAHILFISAIGSSKNFIKNVKETLPDLNYRIIEKPFKIDEIMDVLNGFI